MYDLTTPQGRKEYEDDLADLEARQAVWANKKEVKREPHQEPIILTCWTGMDESHLDRLTKQQGRGFRMLDPGISRSKALWFSFNMQEGIGNPKQYAVDHANGILITYPLKCNSYYDVVTWSDGDVRAEPDEKMSQYCHRMMESPMTIAGGKVIEPPQGWVFADLGHLLCTIPIRIDDSMITRTQAPVESN
jgi:hypothetical protein